MGEPGPLSNAALHKLLRRCGWAGGVPERLAHPHALRAYYATTLAAEGVPVHVIATRLGHAEIQTRAATWPSSPTTAPGWATSSTVTTTRCAAGGLPPNLDSHGDIAQDTQAPVASLRRGLRHLRAPATADPTPEDPAAVFGEECHIVARSPGRAALPAVGRRGCRRCLELSASCARIAILATLAASRTAAWQTLTMVFLPNRQAIAEEQSVLNEPLYAAEREPLLALLQALPRATSPHDFFPLHRDLLVRYRSRQEAIDSLRRDEESEKGALKRLTAEQPIDRHAVREQQDRIGRLGRKIATQLALQSVLRTVGDGLAWKALGYDRAAITVLGNGTRVDRLASAEGLESELAVLEEYWDRGVFAIHNDITGCLRHGDVTAIFSSGRREVVEVKTTEEPSPNSPQMRRLTDATTLVNQRRHTFADGSVHAIVDLDTPYRTGLSHVRALTPKARRSGYAASRVGTCQMVAVVDNRLTLRDPEAFLRDHQRAVARAGMCGPADAEACQHSTLVRRMREKKHSFPALAPLSIFPLDTEDLADLLLGYLDLFTAVNVTALGKSFRRRGIDVRFAEHTERDELFLEARRIVGNRELLARAGPTVREQMLLELMTPASAIACIEATLDAVEAEPAPQPVARVVALANERRVWESVA